VTTEGAGSQESRKEYRHQIGQKMRGNIGWEARYVRGRPVSNGQCAPETGLSRERLLLQNGKFKRQALSSDWKEGDNGRSPTQRDLTAR